LGIDPGLRLTGFGIIDISGARSVYITSGVIRVPDGLLASRLRTIYDGIAAVVQRYQPTEAVIEKVFVNVNPASTLLLGHARGAAMTALAVQDLSVAEYTALQVKKSVTGQGRANKEQVQAMVVRLLALNDTPSADAADALACAICHAQTGAYQAMVENHAGQLAKSLNGRGLKLKHGRLVLEGK
jgi:crossover junction endodeoxyribonuclease RuvC